MLAEYALVPDIFDSSCYSEPILCDTLLQELKEPLLQEALVRDLRDGAWSEYVQEQFCHRNLRAKEVIKKLIVQNRLRRSEPALANAPGDYEQWCREALCSDKEEPLTGVIASNVLAKEFGDVPRVASIEKLASAAWWQARSSSIRVCRTIEDYLEHLELVLTQANSLMFIDAHLDPSKPQYQQFGRLLQAARRPGGPPLVEIHRVCYSGPRRNRIPSEDWETCFRENLATAGLPVEVFIWDDFHDRYLITDIIGINLANGFDTDPKKKAIVTWTRLGRKDRDDIQREFDPAAKRHHLIHRFTVS